MSVAHSWAGSGQSAESPRFWSPQQPLSLPEPGSAFGSFLGYCQGLCVCVVLYKDASSKSRGGDDNIPLLAFLFSC